MTWTFQRWPKRGHYRVVVADPPWHFRVRSAKGEGKSPQAHYRVQSLADIQALPVAEWCQPDTWLWLWATNPMLPHALETLKAWGFTYSTGGSWLKTTIHGKPRMGPGFVLRTTTEPFLIGRLGKPPVMSRSVRTGLVGIAREHSRKPEEAYDAAERLFGDGPRMDLFSRERRSGWTGFGDQHEKFRRRTR